MQSIGVAKCQKTDFAPFPTFMMFCTDVLYLSGSSGAEKHGLLGVDAIPVERTTTALIRTFFLNPSLAPDTTWAVTRKSNSDPAGRA